MNIGEDERKDVRRIEPFEIPGEPTVPPPVEPAIEPAPVPVEEPEKVPVGPPA